MASSPNSQLLQIEAVAKTYGEHQVKALSAVTINIARGEFVSLMGASGCGKSTLLNLIAGLDTASSGRIIFDGADVTRLTDEAVTALRAKKIGFVFQFFNLLSTLTVAENVALPLELGGTTSAADRQKRVLEMLAEVGMENRLNFYPAQLSGGEMQRVAIARALVHKPELIVADEPTGNLDSENGLKVLELLKHLNKSLNQTIVMATHSEEAGAVGDRIIRMKDGLVVSDSQVQH
ncbi:MAG: ABC transporter ATP-binding protein [Candidatus Obscuribacterales bacterium]|jgi:putative ABC transport system ATP-binding protein